MITTEAWVLHQGPENVYEPAELKKELFSFADISEHEVLAEPIYGCWESNMSHAVERRPVDICRQRREEKVVIGNAGVVRVLRTGAAVTKVKEGDLCVFVAIGTMDRFGYTTKVVAYDAPGTMGLLAKQMKIDQHALLPIPHNSRYSLKEWAGFSLRYPSAWSNWRMAYGCLRLQLPEEVFPHPYVWAWGGGVSLAQLALAKHHGCHTAMIASHDTRLTLIEGMGITPIDRRTFADLNYDDRRYRNDPHYKRAYQESEKIFLETVKRQTEGNGVSIFIENIGAPVFRATVKAVGRQGVITTQGWKRGMDITLTRAIECIARHTHVHTHAATHAEAEAAMYFAEETGWIPPVEDQVWEWDAIPQLAHDFSAGVIDTYFPLYQINPI